MLPVLPVELRLYVLNSLISEVHPSTYILPDDIRTAILRLGQVDHGWRSVATRFLYQRLVIHSRRQITRLLTLTHYLKHVESLALLPGPWQHNSSRVVNGSHGYCTDDIFPLLSVVAPTLRRLFIMHLHEEEQRCRRWPGIISGLPVLEELIVDRYEGIFPPRLVLESPRQSSAFPLTLATPVEVSMSIASPSHLLTSG
jgi:hypothetical protein